MAKRQFTITDTSVWADRYGPGSAGALTVASPIVDSARSGYANAIFTGTGSGTAATVDALGNFAANDLVFICQAQGGTANTDNNWEFNKISSVGGGTNWTMAYSLINTYSAGAQVYRIIPYSTVNISSTLTGISWNGAKNGIVVLFASQSITITGNLDVNFKGFGGGGGNHSVPSTQGAGWAGGGGFSTGNAGNAGGGGTQTGAHGSGAGGAGMANSGTSGTTTSGGSVGVGGTTAGNASLTIMQIGAGGGSGGSDGNNQVTTGSGGLGAGSVILVSPTINIATGTVSLLGGNGSGASAPDASYHGAGGAGGSGGCLLVKGVILTLGSNCTAVGGIAGSNNFGQTHCGISGGGSDGYIHADYGGTITGTTTPTLNSTRDPALVAAGGLLLF